MKAALFSKRRLVPLYFDISSYNLFLSLCNTLKPKSSKIVVIRTPSISSILDHAVTAKLPSTHGTDTARLDKKQ